MKSIIALAGCVLPVLSLSVPRSADVSAQVGQPIIRRFNLDNMDLEELKPVKPALSKRADDISLQNSLSLAWASGTTSATLTAQFNGTNERIVNMDSFAGVISGVDCTPPELMIDFVDQAAFEAATKAWDWVIEEEDNHFVIVLDLPQCGNGNGWVPYNVTDVRYDTVEWIAYLTASEISYESAIHDGQLIIETLATSETGVEGNSTHLKSRRPHDRRASVSKDIDLAHSYSGTIVDVPLDDIAGASLSVACTDCSTAGTATLKFEVNIGFFKIKKAAISLTTHDVVADINLALGAKVSQSITGTQELWSIQAVGVSIPGIAKLGFGPEVGFGWDAKFSGEGDINIGAKGILTPTSEATLCFAGCDTGSNGWEVNWETQHPSGNGTLSADVNLSTYLTLSAAASLFSTGYEGGVAVVAPSFKGSVNGVVNTEGGVCGGADTFMGVDTKLEVGAEAYAYIGQNHQSTDKRWDFFTAYAPLFDQCFAIN